MRTISAHRRLLALALAMSGLMATTVPTGAQVPLVVTNTDDSGAGSLRQAILDANANPGPDTIEFAAGLTGTITLTTGQLVISGEVTIEGPGASLLTLDGNTTSRVFSIPGASSATISGLTITRGRQVVSAGFIAQGGGGIENRGTLHLSNCVLSSNVTWPSDTFGRAQGGALLNGGTATITHCVLSNNLVAGRWGGGGAVYSEGTLTISDSTVSNNYVEGLGGGGIYVLSGAALIERSTIHENFSDAVNEPSLQNGGGGVLVVTSSSLSATTLTMIDSLVSNNESLGHGGGIANYGQTSIANSTFVGNYAAGANNHDVFRGGGGIQNGPGGQLTVVNSTISGNAGAQGGGILNVSAMNAFNVTLVGNESGLMGGNVFNANGTMTIKNVISANSVSGGDCVSFATLISHGVNYSTDNCGIAYTTVPSTGPGGINLGPLQDNGGVTWTHALLPNSIALDAATDCTDLAGNPIASDQREVLRPQGLACDAGAFEVVYPPAAPVITATPANPTNGTAAAFSFDSTDASATFACALDGSTPAACATGVSYTVGNGEHTFTVTATNDAGTSSPATFSWTVDTVAPSITVTTPADAASYQQNAVVDASYACDGTGSGVQSCTGPVANGSPIDTSTSGPHTFTVDATDAAGNTRSVSVSYTVQPLYQFEGFSSPVSSLPALNRVKAGANVPLKWMLKDGSGQPITTLASVQLSVQDWACTVAVTADVTVTTADAITSGLQNFGDGSYQYNWKTSAAYAGTCKLVTMNLGDGVPHQALFEFARGK